VRNRESTATEAVVNHEFTASSPVAERSARTSTVGDGQNEEMRAERPVQADPEVAPDKTEAPKRGKKRFFRFSLRTLMIAGTLLMVCLAIWSYPAFRRAFWNEVGGIAIKMSDDYDNDIIAFTSDRHHEAVIDVQELMKARAVRIVRQKYGNMGIEIDFISPPKLLYTSYSDRGRVVVFSSMGADIVDFEIGSIFVSGRLMDENVKSEILEHLKDRYGIVPEACDSVRIRLQGAESEHYLGVITAEVRFKDGSRTIPAVTFVLDDAMDKYTHFFRDKYPLDIFSEPTPNEGATGETKVYVENEVVSIDTWGPAENGSDVFTEQDYEVNLVTEEVNRVDDSGQKTLVTDPATKTYLGQKLRNALEATEIDRKIKSAGRFTKFTKDEEEIYKVQKKALEQAIGPLNDGAKNDARTSTAGEPAARTSTTDAVAIASFLEEFVEPAQSLGKEFVRDHWNNDIVPLLPIAGYMFESIIPRAISQKGEAWVLKNWGLLTELYKIIAETQTRQFYAVDELLAPFCIEMIERAGSENAVQPQALIDDLRSLAEGDFALVYAIRNYRQQAEKSAAVSTLRSLKKEITPLTKHRNIWIQRNAQSLVENVIPGRIEYLQAKKRDDDASKRDQRLKLADKKRQRAWQAKILGIGNKMIERYSTALDMRIAHKETEIESEPGMASIAPRGVLSLDHKVSLCHDIVGFDRELAERYGDRYIRALNFLVPHECGHTLQKTLSGENYSITPPAFDGEPFVLLASRDSIASRYEEVVIDRIGYELANRVYVHNALMLERDYNRTERHILGLIESVRILIEYSRTERGKKELTALLPDLARHEANLHEQVADKERIRESILSDAAVLINDLHKYAFSLLADQEHRQAAYDKLVTAYRKVFRDTHVELCPRTSAARTTTTEVEKDPEDFLPNRREAVRQYLISLGADFNKLEPDRPVNVTMRGTKAVEYYTYDEYMEYMIPRVQALAKSLKRNVGIHVMPSAELPGIMETYFLGNAYGVVPDVLRQKGVDRDVTVAKDFLHKFIPTFHGAHGFGYKTRNEKPSVPVALFINDYNAHSGKVLSEGYFLHEDLGLDYSSMALFEEKLYGMIQWEFDELDGVPNEIVRMRMAEKYIDKLLEIAQMDIEEGNAAARTSTGEPGSSNTAFVSQISHLHVPEAIKDGIDATYLDFYAHQEDLIADTKQALESAKSYGREGAVSIHRDALAGHLEEINITAQIASRLKEGNIAALYDYLIAYANTHPDDISITQDEIWKSEKTIPTIPGYFLTCIKRITQKGYPDTILGNAIETDINCPISRFIHLVGLIVESGNIRQDRDTLTRFIERRLRSYELKEEFTPLASVDKHDIVAYAIEELLLLNDQRFYKPKYGEEDQLLYVRSQDRKLFFRKEYSAESEKELSYHSDMNNPVREYLGSRIGRAIGANVAETVVTPENVFAALSLTTDPRSLPQQTMAQSEAAALVLNIFIRRWDDPKFMVQRSRVEEAFVSFDFDQGFAHECIDMNEYLSRFRWNRDQMESYFSYWNPEDFDIPTIWQVIEEVKRLDIDALINGVRTTLRKRGFPKESTSLLREYSQTLKATQETIEEDVRSSYKTIIGWELEGGTHARTTSVSSEITRDIPAWFERILSQFPEEEAAEMARVFRETVAENAVKVEKITQDAARYKEKFDTLLKKISDKPTVVLITGQHPLEFSSVFIAQRAGAILQVLGFNTIEEHLPIETTMLDLIIRKHEELIKAKDVHISRKETWADLYAESELRANYPNAHIVSFHNCSLDRLEDRRLQELHTTDTRKLQDRGTAVWLSKVPAGMWVSETLAICRAMPKTFLGKIRTLRKKFKAQSEILNNIQQKVIVDLAKTKAKGFMSDDIVDKCVEEILNSIIQAQSQPQDDDSLDEMTARTSTASTANQEDIADSAQRFVERDINMLLQLLRGDYINPEFFKSVHLRVEINNNRISKDPTERGEIEAIAEKWLNIVQSHTKDHTGQVAFNGSNTDSLIKITASRDTRGIDVIGECAIDANANMDMIPEIIGMLNIAFAGSLIPEDPGEYEKNLADYGSLINYIEHYHFLITGESYLKEDLIKYNGDSLDIEEMKAIIENRLRVISIDLPPAQKIKYNKKNVKALLTAV